MIQTQLKLRLNTTQDALLTGWLWNLTGVWNWACRKIQLDARDKIFYSAKDFQNLLAGHSEKMEIPSHTLQGMLSQAHLSWTRCFKKLAKKPRLKGMRNKLNSIPFPDPLRMPIGNHIAVPGLGSVRFHRQDIPAGKIKCGRIVKRASGWYLCLFIAADRKPIAHTAHGQIGIDPGFKSLLTTSEGEIIQHPRELEAGAQRLGQAQRGDDKKLAARLQERMANRRKDRNHKLSRQLVAQNDLIAFSADNHKSVANKFGKSVSSSSHYQLRRMLSYKSRAGGTEYIEVDSKFSTKTCSNCGSLSGPSGWAGLSVRQWRCIDCGSLHDRDINAARNTLFAGAGLSPEVHYAQA
jgi:putative transposase